MEKWQQISTKIYKHLRNKKCNKKVHNIYVALFRKRFVFNKRKFCDREGTNFIFRLYKESKTRRKGIFYQFYFASHCAFRCTVLCNVVNLVVQFYLIVWEDKFLLGIYSKVHFEGHTRIPVGSWTLDAGLWTLDSGRQTLDAKFWMLDTVVDCFRTESEQSFWFCLIRLLKTLWVRIMRI